jgi:hypothetical protein
VPTVNYHISTGVAGLSYGVNSVAYVDVLSVGKYIYFYNMAGVHIHILDILLQECTNPRCLGG